LLHHENNQSPARAAEPDAPRGQAAVRWFAADVAERGAQRVGGAGEVESAAVNNNQNMNIETLTIGEARQIAELFGSKTGCAAPFNLNKNYFIRTVTHHLTGKLVAIHEKELVLEKAAWIADDGRFSDALKKCEFNEVEPFPDGSQVIVGRAAIIDAVEIRTIPTSQK
jgi:hypothetical protein